MKRANPSIRTEINYSLEKALKILILLGESGRELGISELSAATDFPLSTISRIIKTLVKWGFVEQDPATKKFTLGPTFQRLIPVGLERSSIIKSVAHPILYELRDKTNETSHLYIRQGVYRVHLDFVESRQELRTSGQIGDRVPIYSGAAARVLWAFDSHEEIDALLASLDLVRLTDKTIIEKERLYQEAAIIRNNGYAVSCGERNPSICSVSAPIFSPSGKVVASIGVSIPNFRFNLEYEAELVPEVLWAAKEITARLK